MTARLVCKWAGVNESPLIIECLETFKVRWSMLGSFGLPFRAVPADDDKFHRDL